MALTGGGASAIGRLLAVPGASRTIAEIIVPYANQALADLLGRIPEQACSQRTARAMAMRAFQRTRSFGDEDAHHSSDARLFGIGVTAALVADRPRRGSHRVHVAVQTLDATNDFFLVLAKGARSRADEDSVAADLIVHALAAMADIDSLPPALTADDQLASTIRLALPGWRALLDGRTRVVDAHGLVAAALLHHRVIFPGAFDPFHDGHAAMARLAAARCGRSVEYELCIENVDKPPLDYATIGERIARLPHAPVWLTRAPTFADKARLFPAATFVVGADTITRIGEVRYYGGDAQARDRAIDDLSAAGVRFLVFGRQRDGRYETLADLALPPALAALADGVGEAEFRVDVSSTALRAAGDGELADADRS